MRKRIFAIFAAFLVLSSGVAAPASAFSASDATCEGINYFIGVTFYNAVSGSDASICSEDPNDQIESMKESDGNQTAVDIYNSALAEDAAGDQFTTTQLNYVQDSESVAWMKMQVAVAEAYQNGSSESLAKSKAKAAIDEYYSTMQMNLIHRWDSHVTNMEYLDETAENESGVNNNLLRNSYDGELVDPSWSNHTVTLANGTEVEVRQFEMHRSNAVDAYWTPQRYDGGSLSRVEWHDGWYDHNGGALFVEPPTDTYEWHDALNPWPYLDAWTEMENTRTDLHTESENFVNATYGDFDSGEINASDVISANTAMFEYATEGTQNDSSLYDSTAALTMMGFDTPNMSSSGTMDVTTNGDTYTGILLARNAPGGGWDTGTTYNTSNITGPVFIATVDGQKIDIEDSETFTVDQMRAKDGTNVTQVNTTKYVYKTANTSEVNEMQQQLIDLRKEIEAREPTGGGGSGGLGLGQNTIIAVAALAGAALLLGRKDQ